MKKRLILSYLTVTLFTLLVLEIPLGIFVGSLQRERLGGQLQRDAMVLATLFEDALDNDEPYTADVATEYAERTGGRVVVVDDQGMSIVDTAGPVDRDFTNRPEIEDALAGFNETPAERYSATLGRDILFAAAPVASGGVVHGAVRITFDPETVDGLVRRYWWGLGAIGLVVLVAVAFVGWIIARSVTRPLSAVHDAAMAAGSGDLSVRIDPGEAPIEVEELAAAFNMMSARLQGLIERQHAFVADASHELRTPLTALRLRLENLEDAVDADARADLVAAIAESERLAELVNKLLVIARTEAISKPVRPAELVSVVRDRCELWTAVAEEQGATLWAEVGDPVFALAVEGGIEQIIDNLVSNALAVTQKGGNIVVRAATSSGMATLSVSDEGPGMTAEEREHAFNRFWRADHSKPGSGLGLAIVRELAVASGGDATLMEAPGGGTEALVRFAVVSASHTVDAKR